MGKVKGETAFSDKERARKHKYYVEHKEEQLQRGKEWRDKHPNYWKKIRGK